MLHGIKGAGGEAIRERVANSPPLPLKYLPIPHGGAVAVGGLKTLAEVRLDPVVVEQRIVDVEQKDGADRSAHGDVPVGDCKKSSWSMTGCRPTREQHRLSRAESSRSAHFQSGGRVRSTMGRLCMRSIQTGRRGPMTSSLTKSALRPASRGNRARNG